MKRTVAVTVALLFVVASAFSMSLVGWWTMPLGLILLAGAWLGGRCWHRDISLLPPVPGAGAGREFARWHCNECGATWAAGLESSTRPRPLYSGYDQAKAEQAAARADTLERERRRLAIERAGLAKHPTATVAVDTAAAPLTRVAAAGRVRRLSVDAATPSLDQGGLAHRRPADDLPRIRPLRG